MTFPRGKVLRTIKKAQKSPYQDFRAYFVIS